jgi:hypothetical protein
MTPLSCFVCKKERNPIKKKKKIPPHPTWPHPSLTDFLAACPLSRREAVGRPFSFQFLRVLEKKGRVKKSNQKKEGKRKGDRNQKDAVFFPWVARAFSPRRVFSLPLYQVVSAFQVDRRVFFSVFPLPTVHKKPNKNLLSG